MSVADVFAWVVCAAAGCGLGDSSAEHVSDDSDGGQDPEQPGVDAGAGRGRDPEPDQIEREDEELAGQVEGLVSLV